jgi:AraC-like DNA-binding protein
MLLYLTLSTFGLALLLLLHNFKKNKTAVYVSLFLMIVSLYGITHYFVLFGQSPFWIAVFYNHFTPLYLLLGPLLFFYVRGTLTDQSALSTSDSLHFLPAIIQAIGITPYVLSPFALKEEKAAQIIANIDHLPLLNLNIFYTVEQSFSIRAGLLLLYTLYCIYYLVLNSSRVKSKNQIPAQQFKVSLQWLMVLVSCTLIIALYFLYVTLYSFYSSPKEAFANTYALHLISGISYFIMTFSLLLFPHVLYGMPRKTITVQTDFRTKDENKSKDATSISDEDPLFELSEKMKNYLQHQKPYLDPEFSMSTIAVVLQVPQNHISYCINSLQKTTFYKLRSELRVAHAITLLQSETKDRLTIEAIGAQSGFKTRSNFYAAFKEITGMTPTEYSASMSQQLV